MARTAIVVLVLAVLTYGILSLAQYLGFFSHHYKHHPGKCRKLNPEGIYGSENFQVTSDGLAFITSGVFIGDIGTPLHNFLIKKAVKGRIFTFDFKRPNDTIVDLKIKSTKTFDVMEFHPIGISLLEDKTKGEHLIYVINNPVGQPCRVEKFRYLPKTKELRNEKTFLSEKIYTLNDIAVVKEDVFYVTNFLYFVKEPLSSLQHLFPYSPRNILYFNGTDHVPVVPGLNGPNGAALSADNKFLYVNFPLIKRTMVYSRDSKDGALTLVQTVDFHTAVDNLHLSQSGDALYSGCQPVLLRSAIHFYDLENEKAPSQVLRLPLKDGLIQVDEITELFYDHGDLISAASSATVYNDLLLIGSVLNNLVVCDTKGL